jgi:hypothetical protein
MRRWLALGVATFSLGCAGPPGPAGPPGADGSSGLSGYEIVRQSEVLSPSAGHRCEVRCPEGKRAVGGGWRGASDTINVFSSTPHRTDAWQVWLGNSFGMVQQAEAFAVCVDVGRTGSLEGRP